MTTLKKRADVVMQEIDAWFRGSLGCMAGRREYQLGRYMVVVIDEEAGAATMTDVYRRFLLSTLSYEKTACLLVFNTPEYYAGSARSALDAITYLAERMRPLSQRSPDELIRGAALRHQHALRCPVTGAPTIFTDFDAIAFCPQAADRRDPLYDPLMSAPFPCVNISSDEFGLAMFTRDQYLARHRREICTARDERLVRGHFASCIETWNRIALKTINNFIDMTDTTLCPTYLSADGCHWFANHQDPAFAEVEKSVYRHELPRIYGPRIAAGWCGTLYGGRRPSTVLDATRPGELL